MRNRWSRVAGVIALVATLGTAAAAFQIDPEVVTQVTTPATGLWIPAPSTGEIVRVDAASGRVTARVKVGDPGAEFVIDERENGVVVVDRIAGRVSLIDPALHTVIREVGTLSAPESLVDIGPEVIVAASGTRVDLIDLNVTTSTAAVVVDPSRSIAASGLGAVGSTGTERFDIAEDGTVDPNGEMDGIVIRVLDRVVVATENSVRELNGGQAGCFDGDIGTPSHLISTADEWVVAITDTIVHVSDLSNGACVAVDLGPVGLLGRPVAAAGRIFVPERATGTVHIVAPEKGTVVAHPILGGGSDLRIRARDDFVVAYDATSPVAALLDGDGFVRFIDTSVDHRGITAVLGDEGSAALVGADDEPAGTSDGADGVSTDETADAADPGVLAATLENPVDVEDSLPTDELIANFGFSATTVAVNELVRFVDSSTGSPEAWSWDFGDGTGAEGPEVEKAWDSPGTYPVALRVTRGDESAEISLSITVVPEEVSLPPAADFQLSSSVVNVGKPISFEDRSDGEIERWRWDFGDGTSATAPNVSKSWAKAGLYTVTLTVANSLGPDSASVVVEVVANLRPPVAVLSVDRTDVDLGMPVTFNAVSTTDPATFRWDFGDGRSSTGAEVIHVFLQEGTFAVTLTAKNDAGVSTTTAEITVSPPTLPPIAIIGALPPSIEVGDSVTLSSLSTNSPDSHTWAFGDSHSASGALVDHTWDTPGTYVVSLTASNSAGADTESILLQVLAELPPPIAQIADFPMSPWVGDSTVFVDGSLHATSWLWDFGDGVTSTARDPLHTFTTAGQKVVNLTVTNRNGTDTTSAVVEPRLRPTANFFPSSTGVRAGESVAFTDTSVNAVNWFWDFGDGEIAGSQNPSHVYTDPGSFNVSLTVESATGNSDTFGPVVITVDPAAPLLTGIRKVPNNSGSLTTLVADTFEAQVSPSSGPIDLYRIEFGDGGTTEGVNPRFTHTYSLAGSYVVRMQARGPLGDWSSWVTRSITVADPPPPLVAIADFPPNPEVGTVTLTGVALDRSGPVAAWRWEITRGGNLWVHSGRVVTHNFAAAGTYLIKLIAESPVPAVPDDVKSRSIIISNPPAPVINSIVANPARATTGVLVRFTPDVTGSVSTWAWSYEGGTPVAGQEIGTHVFNTAGTYDVLLRVTGPFGQQDSETVKVVVDPKPAPSAPLASPASPVVTGTAVSLTSTESNGLTGLTWDWRISNGIGAPITYQNAGQAISHTFNTAGSWTITVTATDSLGISGSAVSFMTVENPVPPLVANFSSAVVGPLQIQFTDTSTGPSVVSWEWNFGTPAPVSGNAAAKNPLVTFSAPGSYSVSLTVRSADAVDTVVILVTVA